MHRLRTALIASALAIVSHAHATQDTPKEPASTGNLSGLHDFDFLAGAGQIPEPEIH